MDYDVDGYRVCDGDCDDRDPDTHPGAEEICDGKDNDCNGELLWEEMDHDDDGYLACLDDCNDNDPEVYPGAPEGCNGIDNDCDGEIASWEHDDDIDGYRICEDDCDDTNPDTYPGAPEICDGEDNDCDGQPGPEEVDRDEDNWMVCENDCDDLNPDINPGEWENCFNGIDDDCDDLIDMMDPECWIDDGGIHMLSDEQEAQAFWSNGMLSLPVNGSEELLEVRSGDLILSPFADDFILIVSEVFTDGVEVYFVVEPAMECGCIEQFLDKEAIDLLRNNVLPKLQ